MNAADIGLIVLMAGFAIFIACAGIGMIIDTVHMNKLEDKTLSEIGKLVNEEDEDD